MITQMSSSRRSQTLDASSLDYVECMLHLLSVAQQLCGQTQGVVDRLCKEVRHITRGCAELLPHRLVCSEKTPSFNILLRLPVQFGGLNYGTLAVAADAAKSMTPALPLDIAHLLAMVCGWLLYTFEQAAFVQGRCSQLDHLVYARLTKREREILVLIGQGYDREAIADRLSIAYATVDKHRQHIYEQLGVHCERDALLAAYCAGLFSPIEAAPC